MQHLIISRVNLHMDLDKFKYSDTQLYKREGWESERIKLLNDWCRASLRKQSNQNFTFISLWWERCPGGGLKNEMQIPIERTGTHDDEPLDYEKALHNVPGKNTINYAGQITKKVKELFDAPILCTNLDCDDALHKDFVQIVQDNWKDSDSPYYIDTETRYIYNIETGEKGEKRTSSPSPFVTTWEPEIKCYPLRFNHTYLSRHVQGKKIPGLYGLQTVNGSNMFSKQTGTEADFDLEDYA